IADLDNLEDAIQGARKIEAGEYYTKKNGRDEVHDSEVARLTQQMQVLTTGYEKLTTALATYFEARPRSSNNHGNHGNHGNNNARITCYNCGEPGHISRNCMSERTQNQNRPQTQNRMTPQAQPQVRANHAAPPIQILPRTRDANHISIIDEQDENVDENEAFTAPSARHQPYTTQRPSRYRKVAPTPANEGSRPNQSPETVPTMAPSSENPPPVMPAPVISVPVMPAPAAPISVDPPQVPRRKRGPSVVDNLEPYNIVQDLLNMKANVSYGQMLQYPDQKRHLANAMKRPLVPVATQDPEPTNMEVTTAQAPTITRTTAA
ncbi:11529_t:CDS:1, partial [Cetraspora pellucida]